MQRLQIEDLQALQTPPRSGVGFVRRPYKIEDFVREQNRRFCKGFCTHSYALQAPTYVRSANICNEALKTSYFFIRPPRSKSRAYWFSLL